MALCPLCKEYPEGTACTMTGCPGRGFRIDGAIHSRAVTAPADTLNTAGADNFTAAINDTSGNAPDLDRTAACDGLSFPVEHEAHNAR